MDEIKDVKKGGSFQIKFNLNGEPWRMIDGRILKDTPDKLVLIDDIMSLFFGDPYRDSVKRTVTQTRIRKAVHEWNVANGEED